VHIKCELVELFYLKTPTVAFGTMDCD